MKVNKYFPFAFVYFFVNSIGLPFGLTYTSILSPFFYGWVTLRRKKEILIPFISILLIFAVIHISNGADVKSYLISTFSLLAVYIFGQAFYTFLKSCRNIEGIFWRLLKINFIFCLIAIPIYFTSYREILWIRQYLTDGFENFLRLKLFTYEASYYATLFTPLFFFFYLQIILTQNKHKPWILFVMIVLPYLLSFSMGVISAVLISMSVTYFIFIKRLTRKKRVLDLVTGILFIFIIFFPLLVIFFPDNVIFVRLSNIFSGADSSGRGRTYEAFILASKMLEQKSFLWGIGPGQVKLIGAEIIRDYYLYPLDHSVFAIPNAMAETLAIFGWVGLLLRVVIEFFLFFYTRVWTNYFRLLLFVFIFLYQFSGSFITNLAEYVIWILAFTNIFPQFDVLNNIKKPQVKL